MSNVSWLWPLCVLVASVTALHLFDKATDLIWNYSAAKRRYKRLLLDPAYLGRPVRAAFLLAIAGKVSNFAFYVAAWCAIWAWVA